MKSFPTVCCLVLLTLFVSSGWAQLGSPDWTTLNSGTSEDLLDVYFADEFHGWIVGKNGTALRTINGGNVWIPMNGLPSTDITSLDFANQDTGYAVARGAHFYYTHDGGLNWQQDTTVTVNCFMEKVRVSPEGLVYFLYFGCFDSGHILTWDPSAGVVADFSTNANFGFSYADSVRDIDFPAPGLAYAVGDSGMLLRSTTGGSSWDVIPPPDSSYLFVAVDFIDADTGFAQTYDPWHPRIKTTDGGQTWFTDPDYAWTFFYPLWFDMEFLPSGFGMEAGTGNNGDGLIFFRKFLNAGGSGAATFPDTLYAIDVLRDSLVWVVGANGFISRLGTPMVSSSEANPLLLDLDVFPNPSEGHLQIKSPAFRREAASIQVWDARGMLVHAQQVPPGPTTKQLDLSPLPAGMYLLKVEAGNSLRTTKITLR